MNIGESKARRTDPFLKDRFARYDRWLRDGKISHSAKVIPVTESIQGKQWVLPTEQAAEILRDARSVAVQACECRVHYQRCDHPLDVCLLLNDVADGLVAKGEAHPVSMAEATEILRKANESGLVHLTLYMPDHRIYALCSCCPCCCHDLQIIEAFERPDLMVRSDYVALTDRATCIDCGDCVPRCYFGARSWRDEQVVYDPDACVGCGLCVTVCPVEATIMVLRNPGTSRIREARTRASESDRGPRAHTRPGQGHAQ